MIVGFELGWVLCTVLAATPPLHSPHEGLGGDPSPRDTPPPPRGAESAHLLRLNTDSPAVAGIPGPLYSPWRDNPCTSWGVQQRPHHCQSLELWHVSSSSPPELCTMHPAMACLRHAERMESCSVAVSMNSHCACVRDETTLLERGVVQCPITIVRCMASTSHESVISFLPPPCVSKTR